MPPLLLALPLALGAPALKEKPPALDLAGEWVVAAYVLGGQAAPPGVHIHFAADGKATFSGGPPAATTVGEYTLNAARSPAEVDIVFPGSGAGAMIGLVRRDGDHLRICFGPPGARPTKFESPAGSGVGLLTLKRATKKD
jgi:uncharacterized protein (TIGR03067 family)